VPTERIQGMEDAEALERLGGELGTLLPRLRRFARALTNHAEDADDLVQLALERAVQRVRTWDAGRPLLAWLMAIMRNAWIDELRSRQRGQQLFVDAVHGEQVGDDAIARQVEGMAVADAMRRLPTDQRVVVALVLVEGLSYQEAAQVLEIPLGTLTSRLSRAREALKGTLGENE